MIRIILIFVLVFYLLKWIGKWIISASDTSGKAEKGKNAKTDVEGYKELTDQKIEDADYEDL